MTGNDTLSVLRAWASSPLKVGAEGPSTWSLASLITREIGPENGRVLELGAGSGSVTRALLACGVREANLSLVEFDPEHARLLRQRYPRSRVLEMDATCLRHLPLFEGAKLGAAICNLSLLALPPRHIVAILEGVFTNLHPGAAMYVSTYGFRCPVEQTLLDCLDLEATRIGSTFRHLPPATVYRISRIRSGAAYDRRYM